jgi:calcium binding protein 39
MVNSNSSSGPTTPFEWLSGGLFGKKAKTPSEIDTCKDVSILLNGVHESLSKLFPAMPATTTTGGDVGVHVAVNNTAAEGVATAAASATTTSAAFTPTATAADEPDVMASTEELEKQSAEQEKIQGLLSARLYRLRFLLYDERRQTSQAESPSLTRKPAVATKMSETLSGNGNSKTQHLTKLIIPTLLHNLVQLPFETRKDVSAIFSYLLLCGLDGGDAEAYQSAMKDFRDFIDANFDEIMPLLVDGHNCGAAIINKAINTPDVVLHSGTMFRSCIKHLVMYEKLVATSQNVERFVFPFLDTYAHSPNFDCASDAMDSLKLILTGGAEGETDQDLQYARYQQAATFLERDYEAIWDQRFNAKLLSSKESNYLIRRMALQILATVLLTRSNYKIMVKYIASKTNLMLVMILLRDSSPHITLDAFHVFKIFVANPNKPPEIIKILADNKVKLCTYLEGLHKDKESKDTQFRDEKALVIATIEAM